MLTGFTNDDKNTINMCNINVCHNQTKRIDRHAPRNFFQLHNNLGLDDDIHFGNFIFCHYLPFGKFSFFRTSTESWYRIFFKTFYSPQTSFRIRMKSIALSIPTNWHLLESHTGAIDIPWKQINIVSYIAWAWVCYLTSVMRWRKSIPLDKEHGMLA